MKTHKWTDVKKAMFSPERIAKMEREAAAEVLEMNLGQLRAATGLTQVDMAAKLEAVQSQLSKIEKEGSDHKLSTLRRYVHALGGELKVQAVVGGKTVDLVL
jgi:DNA-binding XRE family transcriptional regulator